MTTADAFTGLNKFILPALFVLFNTGCSSSDSPASGSATAAALPCPTSNVAFAVNVSNQLICFSLATSATIPRTMNLSGMAAGEDMLAIDFRPATGELYGLGSTGQLYTIDKTSGAATLVGTPVAYTGATYFGFDINPVVDRIRVTTDNQLNARLNPLTGVMIADTNLNYAVGDLHVGATPSIVASAYSDNFAGTLTTTLYGIDRSLDILVTQSPPNNGSLNTVGSLGFNTDLNTSFDIFTDSLSVNHAYAVLTPPSSTTSKLFTINLTTGAATLVDTVGGGSVIRAFAIAP